MDNLQSDDINRGVRQRKKQIESISCPVCGVTVRPSEMEHHYSVEVDRLHKLQSCTNKSKKHSPTTSAGTTATPTKEQQMPGCSVSPDGNASVNVDQIDPKECWNTYQRIKNNRQARLKIKTRKRKSDDPVCPVCNETTTDDINLHVELCLRRSEGGGSGSNGVASDDESIDVEAESFEEYEWAGQTRIRASSLLQGGYLAAGVGTSILNCTNIDEDEDLNVDGDDTQVYGQSQYSERDVIIPSAGSNKEQTENLYLRKLVVGQDYNNIPRVDEVMDTSETFTVAPCATTDTISASSRTNGSVDCWRSSSGESSTTKPNIHHNDQASSSSNSMRLSHDGVNQVIESLKAKIREYELQRINKCKCLICMDEFRIPVVSICCWHVHCEECWLRTLGARKLCPQCNMITSPTDLRRIYM